MSNPLISIVIATYNTGRYLLETLESALAQTYPRCEIILIDDGSTDNTAALVAPYLSRIHFHQQTNQGLAAARNVALKIARGDYIALLDADDLWLPEKLAMQEEVARRHPESGLIACNGVQFDEGSVLLPRLLGSVANSIFDSPLNDITGHYYHEFIAGNPIACPAQTLFPRWVLDEVGPFADLAAQDYDFYLRVAARFPVTFHRDCLVRWRYRPDSMSGHLKRRQFVFCLQSLAVLRAHGLRCQASDQMQVHRQMDKLVLETARAAYNYGLTTDRSYAVQFLTQLFRARPWPPIPLAYLAALLTPEAARSPVLRRFRSWKRRRRPVSSQGTG